MLLLRMEKVNNLTATTHLHIISFDIPYPANYGGVIDVFYKIKALSELNIKIILHCFEYGDRLPNEILLKYCEKVFYYPRKITPLSTLLFFDPKPFIVTTRIHKALKKNLLQDNFPILCEGLHTCGLIPKLAKTHQKRIFLLRMHNVEWKYYQDLANLEKHFFKKIFFRIESYKLRIWEKNIIYFFKTIFCISEIDKKYFNDKFPNMTTQFLPPFHAGTEGGVVANFSFKDFENATTTILFHGKLSVSDNEKAAIFLIENIFKYVKNPCIIAGMNPSDDLLALVQKYKHIKIIANPTENDMNILLKTCSIHLLWTFQNAGMKLKLLNALGNAPFVVANSLMVAGTGLEKFCHICDNPESVLQTIEYINTLKTALNNDEKNKFENNLLERFNFLKNHFSNRQNAQLIKKILDNEL